MASSEKRCLYEVLGVSKECSPDEIRSAYRRLALQRHPDKLVKAGGLSEAEATAQFQELVHAYEVLSDPKERAWYDSHRSQILFADHGSKSGGMPGTVPDLFSFFSNAVYSGYSDTGKGFYRVYPDLFNSIYQNEINFARKLGLRMDSVREAPIMGNLESPYTQVTAFYNYWLGFSTVMDFCWVDQYDVMAGPNRKSRRMMEEDNKKLRKKAKREYNETVRGLAEFVKKRDKRVIDMLVKKNAEMEKKKEEERERRKKMEKERIERARKYEEPEWAKIQEEDAGACVFEQEDDIDRKKIEEFYCVVCSKKFKSEKQWKNHEQSKKHKEKVAELRESFTDYEEEEEEVNGSQRPLENVEDLHVKLDEGLKINPEEEEVVVEEEAIDKKGDENLENVNESGESEDDDDEMSILKKMVFGHKNKRKNVISKDDDELIETKVRVDKGKGKSGKATADDDDDDEILMPGDEDNTNGRVDSVKDEEDFMAYNNMKTSGKNRKGKKGRDKKNRVAKSVGEDEAEASESNSEAVDQSESIDRRQEFNDKASHYFDETRTKSKKSSKGRKTKGKDKNPNNMCEKCGEEFESRNRLHKHLADTGHSTLKSR